jgi:hypothetical protein
LGLFLVNSVRFWPAFKDSKILSWVATVVNACVRDLNDMNDTDIPEDLDIPELVSSWCPPPPWTLHAPSNIECLDSIQGLIDGVLLQEMSRTDWYNSIWVAALATAQPDTSAILPNLEQPSMAHEWSYGTIVRNYAYAYVSTKWGTNLFSIF